MEKKSLQNKEKGGKMQRKRGKRKCMSRDPAVECISIFIGSSSLVYRLTITTRPVRLYLENMHKNISCNEKENVLKCSRTNYRGEGVQILCG